jgi:hypothetical protein
LDIIGKGLQCTDCTVVVYITVEEVPVRRLSFPLALPLALAAATVKTAAAVILVRAYLT